MKIKRFEASSMSDALRMVKKEFGDDAVILSAKTVKKSNRLFGGKAKPIVVVTAAIDRTPHLKGKIGAGNHGPSVQAEEFSDSRDVGDAAQPGAIHDITPITRTGQKKLRSKFIQYAQETGRDENYVVAEKSLYDHFVEQNLTPEIAEQWDMQVSQLVGREVAYNGTPATQDALSQVIAAQGIVAPAVCGARDKQRVVVLVGGTGVGKTTMAAKLAAAAKMQAQSTLVVSLDNYRIAGTVELERYAGIIGFQLQSANGADELAGILKRFQDTELVVIDTPGMALTDADIRSRVDATLKAVPHAEIHLLLSAAWHFPALQNALDFFKPLGVNRLLFTQLDWVSGRGCMANTAVNSGLPISYWSDGAHVPDSMQIATAERLAKLLHPTSTAENDSMPITVIRSHRDGDLSNPEAFYANRNSDIFHRSTCRAVQRINNENIKMFNNESEAMAQMFKPCRMCCADLFVPKPLFELARTSVARSR
jgi:flagellar biosynthesis protein FlhF